MLGLISRVAKEDEVYNIVVMYVVLLEFRSNVFVEYHEIQKDANVTSAYKFNPLDALKHSRSVASMDIVLRTSSYVTVHEKGASGY